MFRSVTSLSQPSLSQDYRGPTLIEDTRNPLRIRRWEKGRLLGKGGFAKVYEARDLTSGELVAVKIVELASLSKARNRSKLVTEIQIHKSLDSPHVVKFLHHFEDLSNVYIFLELCPHESLNELLRTKKRLSETECAYYIRQLIHGLVYLKRQHVIHRDLKLSNLLIGQNNQLKIGDLGLAAKLETDLHKRLTICGTPNYIAPEILQLNSLSTPASLAVHGHSYPVDVWSLGVIVYTLLTGKPPFEDVDVRHTYQRIKDNHYSFPVDKDLYLSSQVKQFISSLLRTNPKDRPSIEDLLRHPWLNSPLSSPPPTPAAPAPVFARPATAAPLIGSASLQYLPTLGGKPTGSGWFVKKWLDYSSKYGMGVVIGTSDKQGDMLSVYFNDSTKMYADFDNFRSCVYVLRVRNSAGVSEEQRHTLRLMTMSTAGETAMPDLTLLPPQLAPNVSDVRKKLILLRNFRSYLQVDTTKEGTERGKSRLAVQADMQGIESTGVHVRKYYRSRQAVGFILSNKTQHVMFVDGSKVEVVIRASEHATFLDAHGNQSEFRLSRPVADERVKRYLNIALALLNGHTTQQHVVPQGG